MPIPVKGVLPTELCEIMPTELCGQFLKTDVQKLTEFWQLNDWQQMYFKLNKSKTETEKTLCFDVIF